MEGNSPEKKPLSRRDFFKVGALSASAVVLAACGVEPMEQPSVEQKAPEIPEVPKPVEKNDIQPQSTKETQEGVLYLENPRKLSEEGILTNVISGVENVVTQLDGQSLTYSEEVFPTITLLTHTNKVPYGAGELLPFIYDIPLSAINTIRVEVKPFSVPVPQNLPKEVNIDPNSQYFVMPTVVSGNDSGIVPIKDQNGNTIQGSHSPFPVTPDIYTGNTNGYLSFALFKRGAQGGIDFLGVVDNNRSKIYVEKLPEEIENAIK